MRGIYLPRIFQKNRAPSQRRPYKNTFVFYDAAYNTFFRIFQYLLLSFWQSISIFSADFSADPDTFSANLSDNNLAAAACLCHFYDISMTFSTTFLFSFKLLSPEYKHTICIRVTTCNLFEIDIHETASTIHQLKLCYILTVYARILSTVTITNPRFPYYHQLPIN